MSVLTSVNVSWNSLWLFALLWSAGFADSYWQSGVEEGTRSVSYKYDSIDEINKECALVLDSAMELRPDENRLYSIKEKLSFTNGDWDQDLSEEGAPLMPYQEFVEFSDPRYPNTNKVVHPTKLVSFWLTDVDRKHNFNKSILVSGILQLGIVARGAFSQKPYYQYPSFMSYAGLSELVVSIQGIYTESQEKNGERVLCLLGDARLPFRQSDSVDPSGWVKEFSYAGAPFLTQDEKILLVLRYPMTATLRSRAILGSMKSLNPKSNVRYFDEVHISSLFHSENYEYTMDNLVSKACDLRQDDDALVNGEIDTYKGLDLCTVLERFTYQYRMYAFPNWKCNGTDDFCSKMGPFVADKEILATNGSFTNVNLLLQFIRCEETTHDDAGTLNVSLVFRAIHSSEDQYVSTQRTGLNNMTISAEGIWKPSSGQICMVGCLGAVDSCDSRISLYFPPSFSVKQRNMVLGSFSSIDQTTKSYFPLEFGMLVRANDLLNQYTAVHPFYKYSKIDAAGAILEKDEPFNFGAVIKKSLLKYPKVEKELLHLREDLTLHLLAVPDPFPSSFFTKISIELELLTLNSDFGYYNLVSQNDSTSGTGDPPSDMITEKQLPVNVSCQLNVIGEGYNNFSSLSLEGIYDPEFGKMYLIGCRDVRASWKILHDSMDPETGLDCLVEVVVRYPPMSSRWLVDPTARISISSQRNEDDPLYFPPIKLQTGPLMYSKQREHILFRRGMEGILRILTLSMAIACIVSQLFYIQHNVNSVPFISHVMLGVHALGYSFPLITGAEALFKKAATDFADEQSYELRTSLSITSMGYLVKLLVLLAFSLTLRLCQKVWRSRIRMLTRAPLEHHRVPSNKKALLTTLIMHTIGYIIVITVRYAGAGKELTQQSEFLDSSGYSRTIRLWEIELEEYVGLVQDFFLLPQVIANLVWQINCRPLRKMYYIGLTSIRLLPHIYDRVIVPMPNIYFSESYDFVNQRTGFYSKSGDIAISITAIFLALIIYVQQRWNYAKLSEKLVVGQATLLPLGSRVYERLPSMSLEAELVSDVNKKYENEHDED
ncbi:hypothetical protein F511_23653 [Dorcoceras hygrometricum]|uniref:RING-type E3 ubiquitin transferase n=1 Tax=Dorcoceras hygrometricum TaxID=472368 RepID=A0A2Z7C967_9LAMI|nr:hypothetical protein F511_23653 [Dorcoceras hygrometricum]